MQIVLTRLLPCIVAALLAAGCGSIQKDKKSNALEAALTRYGAALRWGYYDTAYGFVHPAKRTMAPEGMENIQVTGYDVVQPPLQSDESNASQVVRIDYVHVDEQRVRSLTDRQQWRYEPETETWWLYSGVPEFK